MKRFASRLIAMSLCVLLVGSALASCNKPGEKPPVTGDKTIESSDSLRETTGKPEETTKSSEETTKHPEDTKNDEPKPDDTTPDDTKPEDPKPEEPKPEEPNPEPIIEGPYRIDYLNDCPNVGNCTAQLVLNPSWTEDFTIEIPANSPDGNLITHFSRWNNCFVGDCVPKIISEKTYQEAIMKPLREAAARGEMGSLEEGEFYVGKIDSYFYLRNPSEMKTDAEKENCIKRYPITDPNGANIPIRVFSEDASSIEILMVQNYLSKYTSFTKDTIKAEFAYFQDAIRKSQLNEIQKAKLLSEYQYSENDHLVGLTLPDTLWGVQASDLIGFKDLMQTENGISYIGNWAIRVDGSLTSIELRDGTVGIAEGAISDGNYKLKSMTIPASLKTICGEIAGRDSSFRKLFISDLAAWCAVRCTRYSYSGLGSAFNVAHDLYLNGELLTDLVIPDGVAKIEVSAFERCVNLKSLTIPASVTEIGSLAFNGCTGLTAVYISDLTAWCNLRLSYRMSPLWYAGNLYLNGTQLKDVVIPDGVTTIGSGVFAGCNLTSITIPDSVTSIGSYAFANCLYLKEVKLPSSITDIEQSTFEKCMKLTDITLPNGLTAIGDSAFKGCNSLVKVTIPKGVTDIGYSAFENCTNLTDITLPNGLTAIRASVFKGCNSLVKVTIPKGVTNIGYSAFGNCLNLTEALIPDGVTTIENSVFSGCIALANVRIPESVTSIGGYAFSNCSSLTEITLPDGLTELGGGVFSGCSNLIAIVIPCGVTKIERETFSNCASLTGIVLPSGITEIGSNAFTNCGDLTEFVVPNGVTEINRGTFSGCSGLVKITLSKGILSIGESAFSGCSVLAELVIPSGVRNIGASAFQNCSSLKSLTIPNGVTCIGDGTFSGCVNLVSVELPNGITGIGESAFSGCVSLTGFTIPVGVTKIGSSAFQNCSSLTEVVIPQGVLQIESETFLGCRDLVRVTIPGSVAGIVYGAFYNCSSLTEVNITDIAKWCSLSIDFRQSYGDSNKFQGIFPNSYNLYLNGELINNLVIPDGVTGINAYAFSGCRSITDVTFPDSVTEIDSYAFSSCSSLIRITIPNSMKRIGGYAFGRCNNLAEVYIDDLANWCEISFTVLNIYVYEYMNASPFSSVYNLYLCEELVTNLIIPDGVTHIQAYVFSGCGSLTSVTIPDGVTSIGDSAFKGCSSLTGVYITDLAKWCGISFGNFDANPLYYAHQLYLNGTLITDLVIPDSVTSIGNLAFLGCSSLTSITIPDGVTSIGNSAFSGCSNLTSVAIGHSVTSIGDSAFRGCSNLTGITIPNSVTSIGESAFSGCSSLTSVTIPNSVTSIGDSAFYGCSSLTSITIPDSVTSIGDSAFSRCSSLAIFAEAEAKPSGWNSNWNPDNRLVVWGYDGNDRTYSFETNGGSTIDSVTAKYLTELPTPEKAGFVFCGWYDNSEFAGDALTVPYCSKTKTVLYAKWLTQEEYDAQRDGSSFEKAYLVESGKSYNANITQRGQLVYFAFTPSESKTYTIYSTGNNDTYGYLYNASQTRITSDDDGGSGSNFSITYSMTAGTTYYIVARYYSSSNPGSFSVVFS